MNRKLHHLPLEIKAKNGLYPPSSPSNALYRKWLDFSLAFFSKESSVEKKKKKGSEFTSLQKESPGQPRGEAKNVLWS